MCWRLSLPRKKSSQTTPGPVVASNSGHDHPYHQSLQTGYGSYNNCGQHASEHGIIYNINSQTTNSLEELESRCSHSAAFDAAARFDPPRCAESTRLWITQTIEEWINSDGDNAMPSSLFWLYGGAGVGKSAIAQSLSEKFQKKRQLAASFFFFRGDPSRNDAEHLIPTLVSQLVSTFNGMLPFVHARIRENPSLFTKRYETQLQELLIDPLLALKSKRGQALIEITHPRLIIIDGLDECQNADVQCELLRVISQAIRQVPYPLRFLVTSRPEAHIMATFNHDRDLRAITVHRYNLSDDADADMDIRKFLENEFNQIRQVHRLRPHLPVGWPDPNVITSLVERSSGHFIYASTVIRYIRSPNHRPDDRLEVILRLRPRQEGDRPFAQLDALYALIFAGVESQVQLETIYVVLLIVYFGNAHVSTIEEILDMRAGDLDLLLNPILSLVSIDGDKLRILHKSLFDFLLDFDRSGQLPFALPRALEKRCSHSATFDSASRFNPPRCAESTRLRIIQTLEKWINGDGDTSSLFWLYGGAGVGKSAISQSLSEKFHMKEQLAASFFFSCADSTINNGENLIPTLVSELVDTFKAIIPFIDARMRDDPALFTKEYEIQLQQLLTEPLLALKSKRARALVTHPRLIIIDGLDECQNADVQCELLRVIAQAIRQVPYPLRFLITSRPEAHIRDIFNHDRDLRAITVHRYNLGDDVDANMDIRKFLEDQFAKIRQVHRFRTHLPVGWPDPNVISYLVEQSSGHFIYASTVIRYIRSPKHRPDDRLEVILRLRPRQEGDRPFAQLDALYASVFAGVGSQVQLERICLVLGIVYFGHVHVSTIEEILDMRAGDLDLFLNPILSLVSIDGDKLRILHKPLFHFLLDFDRSGQLPFALPRALEKHCSPTAAFVSAARFDPPRCPESTWLRIIQTIEEWINSDGDNAMPSSLFWLYGGAGLGKSAIAQSFSEKFQTKEQLGASFFFSSADSTRNNGDHLIPTLVSQLVHTFKAIIPFVDASIHENRGLFTKGYGIQLQQLLTEPLLTLNVRRARALITHPRLIIIDGLDECQNADVQCELLRVIAQAIHQIPYPLRFLVTSRPEAHIMDVFNHDRDVGAITVHRYNLSDEPTFATHVQGA